jgi:hypothetical protein
MPANPPPMTATVSLELSEVLLKRYEDVVTNAWLGQSLLQSQKAVP